MKNSVLEAISKDVWQEALAGISMDKDARIKYAKIQGDDDYSIYVAEIESEENTHYHKIGSEDYLIVSGRGMLYTGRIDKDAIVEDVCKTVVQGDDFVINQNWVHQLINQGDDNLIILFGCPVFHLSDDRYFLKPD